MRRIPMTVPLAVLAAAFVIVLALLYRKSAESKNQAARIEMLYRQAKAFEEAAAKSDDRADSLALRFSDLALSPIDSGDIGYLRELGLKDPVTNLIDDLCRHPELIPYPGLHGGRTMGFFDSDRIRILSDAWVYAPFDDGHIGGEALLQYRVAPGGVISWRVVESRLD